MRLLVWSVEAISIVCVAAFAIAWFRGWEPTTWVTIGVLAVVLASTLAQLALFRVESREQSAGAERERPVS